jgi:hypothetical protein
MPLAYGIGGMVNVTSGPVTGNGAPPDSFKGQVGQQYYDNSTTPPTEYVFNGQTWTTAGANPATTTTYGTVLLTDNSQPVATKVYADALAIAGSPVSTTTTAGIGQLSTDDEALAGTPSTGALALFVTPSNLAAVFASPPATGGTTPAAGSFTTLSASGLITGTASADISTGGTTLNLGADASADAINLGTGAAARVITVGNVTGATAVAVNTGTGHFTVTTTGTGDIILNSDDTMLLDADGVLELNSSAGAIGIGNDADAQAINIGTGAADRVITVGNSTGATHVVLNGGSLGVDVGANAIAQTVTIGNVTGATGVVVNSGTNGIQLASTGAGDILLNSSDTLLLDSAGVLELNSSAGVISVGNDAVSQNINVGTAGTRAIAIGNSTATTSVSLNGGTGSSVNIGTNAIAHTVTVGNVTGATAVVLNSGTGGVAVNTTGAGDFVVTSADTVLIDAAGVLELNSSAGIIGIGNDAVAQNINIGTGAAARVVTIGNVSGASQVVLNSGTDGVAINTTGAGDFVVTSSDTVLIDSAGVLELNSSAGVISVGNDAVSQNINVGTAGTRAIVIGNSTATTSVSLNGGTGTSVNIGTNAIAHTVTVGNVTGASAVVLNSGTGGVAINTTGAGDVVVTSADTVLIDSAGVLELNSSAGAISVGNDAVAQTANFNTGAAVKVTNIGSTNTTSSTVINAGSGLITMAGKVALNSAAGPQVLAGAGDPSGVVTAPQGSLWLRTDGSSSSTRAYINTNATTGWTAVTTVA